MLPVVFLLVLQNQLLVQLSKLYYNKPLLGTSHDCSLSSGSKSECIVANSVFSQTSTKELLVSLSTDSSGPCEVTLSRKYAVGISLVPLEVLTFINPRRACAGGLHRPCLSVRPLVGDSLLKRLFVLKTLSHTQGATNVKKYVGICLKPLRSGSKQERKANC